MCIDMYRKSETSKVEKTNTNPSKIFYDEIPSFIEYPTQFLEILADTFRHREESIYDIKRLIGLLKVDNLALDIAWEESIHPISGIEWDFEDNDRYQHLKERNSKMIKYLENIIKNLET